MDVLRNMPDNHRIRTNLALLRTGRGKITQSKLAAATGIGQKTLSLLESGRTSGIDFNTLVRLCDYFDCTPNEILIVEPLASEQIFDCSTDTQKSLSTWGENETTVYEFITNEPVHFDVLTQRTGMQAGELSAALTMLELAGAVHRLSGDWYNR